MSEIRLTKDNENRVVLAGKYKRPWTTTVRKMAEIKAEQLRRLGYDATPGDSYPYMVFISKIKE